MSDKQGARNFLRNLRAEMGLRSKVKTVLRNRARAMRRGCCGHPGEPGC